MLLSWIARGAASAERGRRLMELRGVTPNGHPLWQGWEVRPVLEMYPDYRSIFPLLERRTETATYSKAGRLGITRPSSPPWSDNELLRLRLYRMGTKEDVLAALPGRSWKAISAQARKRGHRRVKPPFKASDILLVDQILERAARLGLTLSALDDAGRRGPYFTMYRYRQHPDLVVHRRVVEALGGQIRARFKQKGQQGQ